MGFARRILPERVYVRSDVEQRNRVAVPDLAQKSRSRSSPLTRSEIRVRYVVRSPEPNRICLACPPGGKNVNFQSRPQFLCLGRRSNATANLRWFGNKTRKVLVSLTALFSLSFIRTHCFRREPALYLSGMKNVAVGRGEKVNRAKVLRARSRVRFPLRKRPHRVGISRSGEACRFPRVRRSTFGL